MFRKAPEPGRIAPNTTDEEFSIAPVVLPFFLRFPRHLLKPAVRVGHLPLEQLLQFLEPQVIRWFTSEHVHGQGLQKVVIQVIPLFTWCDGNNTFCCRCMPDSQTITHEYRPLPDCSDCTPHLGHLPQGAVHRSDAQVLAEELQRGAGELDSRRQRDRRRFCRHDVAKPAWWRQRKSSA